MYNGQCLNYWQKFLWQPYAYFYILIYQHKSKGADVKLFHWQPSSLLLILCILVSWHSSMLINKYNTTKYDNVKILQPSNYYSRGGSNSRPLEVEYSVLTYRPHSSASFIKYGNGQLDIPIQPINFADNLKIILETTISSQIMLVEE